MKPIRIAGAGPSGLSAAISLAKVGYPVEVFERNADVGGRFGGDLQGLENWSTNHSVLDDLRQWNVGVNFHCAPFSKVIVTDGAQHDEYDRGRPLFYLVKRGNMTDSIDQGLKRQALGAGVTIHFNTKLDPYDADIIATGPLTDRLYWVDQGIVFDTTMQDMAVALPADEAGVGGYGYLLVTKGHGCMCTVLFRDPRRATECFEHVKETCAKVVPLDIRNERRVGGTASFTIENRWESGPHKFVGEAAGLQDPLWGFGIRYALWSGYLAAQSIIKQQSYTQMARHAFANRSRAGVVNRYLWERLGNRRNDRVVRRIGHSRDPFAQLRSFYNFNFWQRLLFPLARRRLSLRYPWLGA